MMTIPAGVALSYRRVFVCGDWSKLLYTFPVAELSRGQVEQGFWGHMMHPEV
jgi:hypothetical protein